MMRRAFMMSVHAGREAEYEKRHNPVWPDLARVLKEHGVSNYSIFLDPETNRLFGYAEIRDEAQWAAIGNTGVCKKWWDHMAPLMPVNPGKSPVQKPLREVFHLD